MKTADKMSLARVNIPAIPSDLVGCHWTEDAIKLVNERYLRKDLNGNHIETPEGMCWRVSYHIASADKKYGASEENIIALARDFYQMMANREFFPNAPTLYNAGTGNGLQFSACFVLPIEDSMEGIFDSLKWQALVHKSGGGTGFALSNLRAKNAIVKSTRGKSSGPISFLQIFNAATESVKQGGTRRGANMAIMRVDHPDILEFITCKSVLSEKNKKIFDRIKSSIFSESGLEMLEIGLLETQVANFNISVAATNAFMKAVKDGLEYDLVDPQDGSIVKRLPARMVFDLIVKMAWRTGDPGLWFIDKTNDSPANPIPTLRKIEATNPCGEQPLFNFDVCNLGSIALSRFILKNNGRYDVNWKELERVVRLAVHFLDNVIDKNPYPLPEIMNLAHEIRRIGLGVMGWADMLAYLGIPYASQEACEMAEEVSRFINEIGHNESEELSEVRGSFPLWDKSIYNTRKPIRNCTITTIAPTGEIRILAGCCGGIEPPYGLTEIHKFENRVLVRTQPVFDRFIEVARERGFYSQVLEEEVKNRGKIGDLEGIPGDVKVVFSTAHEISPEWHVRMQASFQKNTDNGVSKTINLPNSATLEDVSKIYWMAYETECLGITVFRDGCKGQVLSVGISDDKSNNEKSPKDLVRKRPNKVIGSTIRVETPDGAIFVTINFDPEVGPSEPFEIFANVAKAGTDAAADAEALGRASSLFLRYQSTVTSVQKLMELRKQYRGIGGSRTAGFGKNKVTSLADGIGYAIDEYLKNFSLVENDSSDKNKEVLVSKGNRCPQCKQSSLIHEESCVRCTNCDYFQC
ncbi:MAG: adenosylcobalamin-dependent ribonucleoside-diphosphate reductase [Patescibacteria group bacterium]